MDCAEVIADTADRDALPWRHSVEDERAAGAEGALVASLIHHPRGDGVGGIGANTRARTPGQRGVINNGIGKEGGAVIELEGLSFSKGRRDAAADGWRGVIGAATSHHRSLNGIRVIIHTCDRHRLGGYGDIQHH